MAKNTGGSTRKGAVKNRSQTYNKKTKMYVKRDAKTGRFLSCKKTSYKGVKDETKSSKSSKSKKKNCKMTKSST